MIRLLFTLLIPGGLVVLAGYLGWKAVRKALEPQLQYVRFRDGILTLKKVGALQDGEVSFIPGSSWQGLTPAQLAASCDRASWHAEWYHYPEGDQASEAERAEIERCLRFAYNTQLLQAEIETT